jgi:uncharacterized membrane protein
MKILHYLKKHWLQFAFLAAPFLLIAVEWNRFPARIPIHWNFDGQEASWTNKTGLLLCPMLNVAVALLFACLPRLDPRLRRNPLPNGGISKGSRIIRLTFAAVLSFISLLIAASALGYTFKVFRLVISAELVLMMVIGNFMSTLRPNYFFGIRTPWTLESPEVWRATHRMGSRIFVFGPLALLVLQFVLSPTHLRIALFAFLGGSVVWALLYSYWRFHLSQSATAPNK